jgi:hypothetical protein
LRQTEARAPAPNAELPDAQPVIREGKRLRLLPLRRSPLLLAATSSLLAVAAAAEEGMWTFANFPIAAANRDLEVWIDQR